MPTLVSRIRPNKPRRVSYLGSRLNFGRKIFFFSVGGGSGLLECQGFRLKVKGETLRRSQNRNYVNVG